MSSRRPPAGPALARALRENAFFCVVLLAATALRTVTVLAYRGVIWFPDSSSYLGVAVRPAPYPARPQGYAFFLRVLEPVHSYVFVAVVQHAMILAAAVAMYALMRRRFTVPRGLATPATLPVLFGGYQLQLEHMLMSDTLYEVLVIIAIVAVLWKPRPGWALCTVSGLAIAGAALTRSTGLPLVALIAAYLLIRRVGWRALGATALACVVPLAAYAIWFHAFWGVYGFTNSTGLFLYGRTAVFADCARMRPPADQRFLCPHQPVAERPSSPSYIWNVPPLSEIGTWKKFTPHMSRLTGAFAKRAIMTQPGDYLVVVFRDLGRTFAWSRGPYPTTASAHAYEFPTVIKPLKPYTSIPGATVPEDSRTYGGTNGATPVVEPYAGFVRAYQDHVRLPGTLLGLIMAAGLAGMVPLWRRLGGEAMLPWLAALAMIVMPPFTSEFGYRYLVPVAPLACLAAAVAVTQAYRRFRPSRSAHASLPENGSPSGRTPSSRTTTPGHP